MANEKDNITKAKMILGLIKTEDSDLTKAKSESSETKEQEEKEHKEKKEKLEKAKAEYDELMKKAQAIKDEASKEAPEAKMWGSTEGDEEGKMPKEGTVAMKAETEGDLKKAETKANDELIKGFNDKLSAAITLIESKDKENEELKKSQADLIGKISSLEESINKIGKFSQGPKSLLKANSFVDRFAPAKEGETTLSLSQNKNQVINELVKAAGSDFGANNMFAKAASLVEYAGALGADPNEATIVASALRQKTGIVIVP